MPAWLKTIAGRTWFKHLRRNDPFFKLNQNAPFPEQVAEDTSSMVLDLDRALAQLGEAVRLCVVLSYHEGMSHAAIAEITGLQLGTVKCVAPANVALRIWHRTHQASFREHRRVPRRSWKKGDIGITVELAEGAVPHVDSASRMALRRREIALQAGSDRRNGLEAHNPDGSSPCEKRESKESDICTRIHHYAAG